MEEVDRELRFEISEADGSIRARGTVMKADLPNAAGIIYPRDVMEKLARQMPFKHDLDDSPKPSPETYVFGPNSAEKGKAQISDLVGVVEWLAVGEDGAMHVVARLLNTPAGTVFKKAAQHEAAMALHGLKKTQRFAFSMSARGTVKDGVVVDASDPTLSLIELDKVTPQKGPYR